MKISDIIINKKDGSLIKFKIKIPETKASLLNGLMYLKKLNRFEGMLFDFGENGFINMWMNNTLIPLDIMFFDSARSLVYIYENAIPHDKTSFGCANVRYALEIGGGRTKKLGITIGDSFNIII